MDIIRPDVELVVDRIANILQDLSPVLRCSLLRTPQSQLRLPSNCALYPTPVLLFLF
ncbi:MAG UNVERIFIED_CONTAM: hypothetical protein LVR18_51115 [Planctomycetaceae bacterium]